MEVNNLQWELKVRIEQPGNNHTKGTETTVNTELLQVATQN